MWGGELKPTEAEAAPLLRDFSERVLHLFALYNGIRLAAGAGSTLAYDLAQRASAVMKVSKVTVQLFHRWLNVTAFATCRHPYAAQLVSVRQAHVQHRSPVKHLCRCASGHTTVACDASRHKAMCSKACSYSRLVAAQALSGGRRGGRRQQVSCTRWQIGRVFEACDAAKAPAHATTAPPSAAP